MPNRNTMPTIWDDGTAKTAKSLAGTTEKAGTLLVIISNKRRAEAIGPTRRIMQATKDKQIEGK